MENFLQIYILRRHKREGDKEKNPKQSLEREYDRLNWLLRGKQGWVETGRTVRDRKATQELA